MISVVVMSVTACPSVLGQMKGEVAKREFKPLPAQTSGNLLRAEKAAWPDSTFTFNAAGKKTGKDLFFYNSENNLERRVSLFYKEETGEWIEYYRYEYTYEGDLTTMTIFIYDGPNSEMGVLGVTRSHKKKKVLPYYDADNAKVYIYTPFWTWNIPGDNFEEIYDDRGNLVSIITHHNEYSLYKVDISYDENNNPVLIDWKDADKDDGVGVAPRKEVYQWDTRGNIVYHEKWEYDGGLKLELAASNEYTYDSNGNETMTVVEIIKLHLKQLSFYILRE